MDRFTAMKIFVRIAQLGSFTAAAAEMGATQSSISKKMAALEHTLGSTLLVRNSRQILMTEVGANFYEHCLTILGELEEAEAQAKEYTLDPKGNLRVNVPVTFGRVHVVPHLAGFMKRYPEINIDLSVLDRKIDLVGEGVDVIIRIGNLADTSLVARKLGSSPRAIVASSEYLESHGRPQTLDDLKRHNCIVYAHLSTGNIWHFGHRGKEVTLQIVRGSLRSGSSDAIRECVRSGLGVAVLPYWLIQHDLEDGSLVSIMRDYVPTEFPINAMYPQNHYVPLKVRCFVKFYKEVFSRDPVFKMS